MAKYAKELNKFLKRIGVKSPFLKKIAQVAWAKNEIGSSWPVDKAFLKVTGCSSPEKKYKVFARRLERFLKGREVTPFNTPKRAKKLPVVEAGQTLTLKKPFDKGIHQGDGGVWVWVGPDGYIYKRGQEWHPAPSDYPTSQIPGSYQEMKIKKAKKLRNGKYVLDI